MTMAVDKALIYDTVAALQAEIGIVRRDWCDTKARLASLEAHVAGLRGDIARRCEQAAARF